MCWQCDCGTPLVAATRITASYAYSSYYQFSHIFNSIPFVGTAVAHHLSISSRSHNHKVNSIDKIRIIRENERAQAIAAVNRRRTVERREY